jgi:hypothetical protein
VSRKRKLTFLESASLESLTLKLWVSNDISNIFKAFGNLRVFLSFKVPNKESNRLSFFERQKMRFQDFSKLFSLIFQASQIQKIVFMRQLEEYLANQKKEK